MSEPVTLGHLFLALQLQSISGKINERYYDRLDFPGGSDGKASAYNVGDPSSIPGLGRSPGEGNDNPFQYSCLENPVDERAWWATVHGLTKESDMT